MTNTEQFAQSSWIPLPVSPPSRSPCAPAPTATAPWCSPPQNLSLPFALSAPGRRCPRRRWAWWTPGEGICTRKRTLLLVSCGPGENIDDNYTANDSTGDLSQLMEMFMPGPTSRLTFAFRAFFAKYNFLCFLSSVFFFPVHIPNYMGIYHRPGQKKLLLMVNTDLKQIVWPISCRWS